MVHFVPPVHGVARDGFSDGLDTLQGGWVPNHLSHFLNLCFAFS